MPNRPLPRSPSVDTLRVLYTHESQWRLLNTLALHNLSTQERQHCSQLDALTVRLKALAQTSCSLERLVAACKKKRNRDKYSIIAQPYVARAGAKLAEVSEVYSKVVGHINEEAVEVRGAEVGPELGKELERFRTVAKGFRDRVNGVSDLVNACDIVEELVGVVENVGDGLLDCGLQAVNASNISEMARVGIAGRLAEERVRAVLDADEDEDECNWDTTLQATP